MRLPSRSSALSAVLVVAVAAGYLISSGSLDVVIGDAVTKVQALRRPHSPVETPHTQKVADWQYFDDRPEWSPQRGVPQVRRLTEGSPGSPVAPTAPAVAPPENPHRFIFNAPPPVPRYSMEPMRSCPQPHGPGDYVENFEVTPIKGGATVQWWDLNDPDLLRYELNAVPEYIVVGNSTRPVVKLPIKTVTIAAPKDCKIMKVSITGLTTGASYRVVLQAFNTSRVQTNMIYRVNRGTTDKVVIG